MRLGVRGLKRKARLATAAAVGAALAVVAGVVSAPPGSASPARPLANSTTFQDSTGEDAQGPDITTVTVSNNDAGLITFRINVPNRPSLTEDMIFLISVDTDSNPATGDPATFGADYSIQLFRGSVDLFRWDGTDFTRRANDPPQASLIFSYAGGATIRITAPELGNTKRFNFGVAMASGIVVNTTTNELDSSNARRDFAPDLGHGFWSYEVKTAPLRLVVKRFRTTPPKPVAGRPYTVGLIAARSDTGAILENPQVRCTATVAFRRLRPLTQAIAKKEAVCVFLIPKTAKGKTIRGSITVVFESLRVSRSFAARIG